ncbi:hypothetical protein GpartN1_g1766.t1 [Galdieria partita]|uniref:Nucleotide-diphospho-sugar transferase domain-containing protein n=1 Tax=Galdieria partita TaxID=83374 RepID=A0A9C7PSZ6_9RHOD|nr:hypothetical protein GpartN1_g1766.t1 [Galdieria partita]
MKTSSKSALLVLTGVACIFIVEQTRFLQKTKSPLRFGIVIYSDKEEYLPYIQRWSCYARLHGYRLHHENTSFGVEDVRFNKIPSIRKHLFEEDWIMFIDADSYVLNISKRLEDYVDNTSDLIVAMRGIEIASGYFLIRPSTLANQFLSLWESQGRAFVNSDNEHLVLAVGILALGRDYALNCYEKVKLKPNGDGYRAFADCVVEKLKNSSNTGGVKILQGTGPWRDYETAECNIQNTSFMSLKEQLSVSSDDFIGEGCKKLTFSAEELACVL